MIAPEFEVGIYDNIPYEDYAAIPAYRSHDLTAVIKCPYTWKFKKQGEQTPAMLEGRVQHTLFLEEHNFDKEFVVQPQIDRRTKAGKEDYETFLNTVGERTVISQDLYDTCLERKGVVQEFVPKPTDMVELTVCFMWHDQPFKARLDWYDNEYIWDLKTCVDASPRGFIRAVNNFNYHMQASLYIDACKAVNLKCEGFKFLAQEKKDPYPYAVYTLSDESIKYAQARNEQALEKILKCEAEKEYRPFGLYGEQVIESTDLY